MANYDEIVRRFLEKVAVIKKLNPVYKQPGDGSDGTCDCIGLIIGAIRRMGLKWNGIHGSNWAARREISGFKKIDSVSDLHLGDCVFKAYEPGSSSWTLPGRYQQGGAYYNGDLRDYYHVGVVTGVDPLEITHMTSPHMKVDYKLGKWAYFGPLTILIKASGEVPPSPAPSPTPAPTPAKGKTAIVIAESGRYVKMRQKPSTQCRLWEEVPIGARVTLESPGEDWAQISYGRRHGWYMMAKFLQVEDDGKLVKGLG